MRLRYSTEFWLLPSHFLYPLWFSEVFRSITCCSIFLRRYCLRHALNPKINDKLEVFFVENNIQTERINYISPVTKATLGDGLILTYDSEKLSATSESQRESFWYKIIDYMDIKHQKIDVDEDVEYFWKVRSSNTYELNYEEIRRVSFYNPTSYKKKALIKTSKNFAFIKQLDQLRSDLKSTPNGIDIHLHPGGSITLDFGFFDI